MFNSFGPSYFGGGYEPYSSYIPSQRFYQPPAYSRPQRDAYAEARARALAEQRARRAQWLPDEEEDEDEDDYAYPQLGPRERMYLEARKRQQELERVQREREEQQRRIEEQRWQKQLEEKQREDEEKRQRLLEQQKALQQKKREEARRMAEEANARKHRNHRSKNSSQIPIDSEESDSAANRESSPPRAPSPVRTPTPRPQYGEEHELAASKIQARYRLYKSLQSIAGIEKNFHDMRDNFTFPSAIDFQIPHGGHITVQVRHPPPPVGESSSEPMELDGQSPGKLAFTSLNYGLHAYSENMLKALMQLDGVESWGSAEVRNRRRAVVKEIEAEVQRLDSYWKQAWRDHLQESQDEESGSDSYMS